MWSVVGEVLPLAVGVAVSPIPIIAAILMLLSPRARSTSLGFLGGWVLGILVTVTVFTLLAGVLPETDDTGPKPVLATAQVVLGAAALWIAVNQWRRRPRNGEEPQAPAWMSAIDEMSVGRAALIAFVLGSVNPKNLLLAVSAGMLIGSAGLAVGPAIGTIAIYTLVAAVSVLVPVLLYLLAADRLTPALESLRGFLQRENSTIMTVLMLVIGVLVIGKGIGNFS